MTNPTAPAQPQKELEFLKPAIKGGLFLGVLSTVPLVNLGCCVWTLIGGARATMLLHKQRPGGLKLGDGALAGILSGLVGTVVSTLINIPLLTYTPAQSAALRQQYAELAKSLNLPPDYVTSMEPMFTPGFSSMRLAMAAITFSIMAGLFSMIGGILTVALLNRQKRT